MGNRFVYERSCLHGQNKVAWSKFTGVCVDGCQREAEKVINISINTCYAYEIISLCLYYYKRIYIKAI